MPTGTPGNYAKVATNGYDLATQMDTINYALNYKQNNLLYQSIGIRQYAPGVQAQDLTLSGFVQRGQGAITAHNLFSPSGIGNISDTEFISLIALGINANPIANQDLCVAHDGTLIPGYKRNQDTQNIQKFNAQLKARGVRLPAFPVLLMDASQKNSLTTSPYDDGAEGNGTTAGGVAILEVLTPTGTQATGTVGLGGLPSDGDSFTITINSVVYVYTFKTSPVAANQIKILGTAPLQLQALVQAMVGSPVGVSSGNVFTGTTPIDPAQCIVSLAGATTVTLTAVNSGTGPNAWTLVKSGVNLTVSAATFAGGVAGETLTSGTVQSSTTSGGAYTAFATFTLDMTKRAAQVITVPVGTTINEWIKVVFTMSGATMTWAARVAFGRFFAGQA